MKDKQRLFKTIVPIVLLLGVAVWVASRWNVWFHNPEEPAYTTPDVPSRVLLTFGDEDGIHSRNVSWCCGDEVRDASLELIDLITNHSSEYQAVGEVFESRSGKSAFYVVRLRNLIDGHCYKYRVCTAGNSSEWYEFSIKNCKPDSLVADKNETTFMYVGDVQDSIGGLTNNYLLSALQRHPEVEFLVCGGDLIERPMDQYYNEAFAGFGNIATTIPLLTVTGNHDYLKGVICTLERRFSLTHSYFLDSMDGDNQVFTTQYGDIQLFALDSNREFFYLFSQRRWLEEKLRESTSQWKVVVVHHPMYSLRGKTNNIIQRWMFDDLFREYGVDLVLQAHEHNYARMTAHADDDKPTTPVYTISHLSPKTYRIKYTEWFDKICSDSRYYQLVTTEGQTMTVCTYDAEADSVCDKISIIKHDNEITIVE